MNRRIIIPAAGESARIGGIPKELLPIAEGDTSLHHAVALARSVGEPVIITSPSKAHFHRRLFHDVEILVQGSAPELWGAIRTGLREDVAGGLIMADTVTNFHPLSAMHRGDSEIMFGCFQTREPHRFSVLSGDCRISTKEKWQGDNCPELPAWGVAFWSAGASSLMLQLPPTTHYDRAFERVMAHGYSWFPLEYYHDLGTFEAYREFMIAAKL